MIKTIDLESKDLLKSGSSVIYEETSLMFIKTCLLMFNVFLIMDDIYLHYYKSDNIYFFYQLILSQLFILLIWVSIRNSVLAISFCSLYFFSFLLEGIFVIYTSYIGYQKKNNTEELLQDYSFQLIIIHDVIHSFFILGVMILMVFFRKRVDDNLIYGPTRMELLSKTSSTI